MNETRTQTQTSETEFPRDEGAMAEWLTDAIYEYDEEDRLPHVHTFTDEGLMTNNIGLIVQMPNGAEFQLTIVQSQQPDDDAEGTE
jgi:hypothetical protein